LGNDHEALSTLDGRGGVAIIALMLVNREGFASNGGLIDLEEGIFSDNTPIGRNDGSLSRLA
jgi:hypothetical protein